MNSWSSLLNGKVVFLAGGAGWIARYIAKGCYEHGARVVLADRDITTINQVKKDIFFEENTDQRIFAVSFDVNHEETIKRAIDLTINKWQTIDILINTAAIFPVGHVEDLSATNWSDTLNTNVRGYALVIKHIVPIFKMRRGGSIINIASSAGLVAIPNFLPYATSKAAIIGMTRNLALDLGPFNIRVNSVSPGAIYSPTLYEEAGKMGLSKEQFDREHSGKCLQRLGQPDEVANLIIFLISDLSSFITGTNISIDGGFTSV